MNSSPNPRWIFFRIKRTMTHVCAFQFFLFRLIVFLSLLQKFSYVKRLFDFKQVYVGDSITIWSSQLIDIQTNNWRRWSRWSKVCDRHIILFPHMFNTESGPCRYILESTIIRERVEPIRQISECFRVEEFCIVI